MQLSLSVPQMTLPVQLAFVGAVVKVVDAPGATAAITSIVSVDTRRAVGVIVEYSVSAPAGSMSSLDMENANNSGLFVASFQRELLASGDTNAQNLASGDLSIEQVYPTASPSYHPSTAPSYSPTIAPTFRPSESGDTSPPTASPSTSRPTPSPSFSPTTPAPTLNTDATLASMRLRYSSTGDSHSHAVVDFSQSDSTEGFSSTWYSYGPVTLSNASYASRIDIEATPSYSGSTVTFYHDNHLILESTGTNITLVGGTQNTFLLVILNLESGVQMQYEVRVAAALVGCCCTGCCCAGCCCTG